MLPALVAVSTVTGVNIHGRLATASFHFKLIFRTPQILICRDKKFHFLERISGKQRSWGRGVRRFKEEIEL
jgi:hypothetical protein